MKVKTTVVCAISTMLMFPLFAGSVYYASPTGSPTAEGTEDDPYDIQTAIGRLGDNTFDEVRLLSGTYKVGSTQFANIDYNASVVGMGARAADVVLDGEGAGSTLSVYYGGSLRNITFTNYANRVVACLNDEYGDVIVSNCVFASCSGANNVLWASGTLPREVRIMDTVFRNNFGNATFGGAVSFSSGATHFERCCFDGNTFSGYYEFGGAAICGMSGDGHCIVDTCVFTNNVSTTAYGGAVASYGWCFVTNTLFACNKATAWGGGAFYSKVPAARTNEFVKCRFIGNGGNFAGSYQTPGGAVRLSGSGMTRFKSCSFEGNTSTGDAYAANGGAVYVDSEGAEFLGCAFTDNSADGYGGACSVWSAGKDVVFSGCAFTNNTATSQCGGAIHALQNNRYRIEDSTFSGNSSRATVGGAVAFDAGVRMAGVDRCHFIRNSAVTFGGGIYIASADATLNYTIRNSLFEGNTSMYGGGVSLVKNCQVDNCTFVTNVCSGEGGAVYAPSDTGTCLRNCLFYGNQLTWATAIYSCDFCGDVVRMNNVSNSCSDIAATFPEANGNLHIADPCFADIAAGDYSITGGSPCCDKGLVLDWMVGAHDIRNQRKIMRVIGPAPDLGCYEFRPIPGVLLMLR